MINLSFKGIKKIVHNLSVGQKVMTVIIVEVFAYSMITTIALSQIHSVGMVVKQMADLYLPLFSSTESIRQSAQDGRLNLKDIIFVGDRVVYDKSAEETYIYTRGLFHDSNTEINTEIGWAENLIRTAILRQEGSDRLILAYSDELLGKLSEIRQANRIHKNRVQKIFNHVEDGSFLIGMEMLGEVSNSGSILSGHLDSLIIKLEKLKQDSVLYAERVESIASRFTIFASAFMVCIVILLVFVIVRRTISNPLHMLTDAINSFDATKEIEESDSEKDLMRRMDELGMVSRSFNKLKHDLIVQRHAMNEAKEEAETANRTKSKFLAAASHDLRQPLHAMQMYITALQNIVADEEAISIIDSINSVSDSTGRILDALLDVSQLEAGSIIPRFDDFPIMVILQYIVRTHSLFATKKGLDLVLVPSSVHVHSDQVLLERILENLVSNAIRYTNSGRVLIGCRHVGNDNVSIEILDTGVGIPEDKLLAVFDDFYQLNNEERDRSKGLGLGLAIARRLANCLNHEICHSSVVGMGSKFSVIVGRNSAQDYSNRTQAGLENLVIDLENCSVLLIEDDLVSMHATAQLFESWGCNVTCVSSVDESFKCLKQNKMKKLPDIIIADYRLPKGQTGIDAIVGIHEILNYEVPSIIVTGEAEIHNLTALTEQGYRILRKPVRPATLRTLISHLLKDSRINTVVAS